MKSLDWTRKLIMMILENLEKFSGKEIKNNPFDRLIPEYIPVVPYNKNSNRIS